MKVAVPPAVWAVTVQQASGVDQAAETTLWPKRILDSTPSSRAVSRM